MNCSVQSDPIYAETVWMDMFHDLWEFLSIDAHEQQIVNTKYYDEHRRWVQ